jgi:GR25 family glycosyltransferase involved in LPS biosynthesis
MNYIDNVYVINMDKSTDRIKNMGKNVPIMGKPFTRVSAIVGKELSKKDLQDYTSESCQLFCTPSMIGCYLSHKKTWETMITNNDKYALIMEDDCELIDTFQEDLKMVLDELIVRDPDFDFIYLGCMGMCDPDKNYNAIAYLQGLFMSHFDTNKKQISNTYSFIPEAPIGFHCYIISQKCAKQIVKSMNKANHHVDVDFVNYAVNKELHVYASKKQLGYQFTNSMTSTQTSAFPVILNKLTEPIKCKKNISYSYYMSAPVIGVFGYNINLYLIILLLITLCIPLEYIKTYISIIVIYLSIELLMDYKNYDYILLWSVFIVIALTIKNKLGSKALS